MTISLTRKEIGIIQNTITTEMIACKHIKDKMKEAEALDRYKWYQDYLETLQKILNKIVDNEKDINKQENFFEIIDNIAKK